MKETQEPLSEADDICKTYLHVGQREEVLGPRERLMMDTSTTEASGARYMEVRSVRTC